MQTIVSVIIPTYNREKFIGDAIQSVLNQNFPGFEIIVIDDGSTDHTADVVRAFKSQEIRYIYQPNCGRSNARNHALGLARGRYIAFLDSDDLYLPGKLLLQVAYMEANPKVGMIYTSARCVDENGVPIMDKYEATASGWIYERIAFFVPVTITLPTVMVRREVFDKVGSFDEAMERFEDTDIWRRISKHYQISALNEQTCLLRTHRDNALAAQDPAKIAEALNYYIEKIGREDGDIGVILRRKGIARLYGYYGAAMRTNPRWRALGYSFLLRAMRSWPFNLRNIARLALYHMRKG
jgi:glycosyltransferase involved in cell wall biosynthesis